MTGKEYQTLRDLVDKFSYLCDSHEQDAQKGDGLHREITAAQAKIWNEAAVFLNDVLRRLNE